MPLVYVPLLAAATLVFTPVAMVIRSVARGRDALLFARPLRADIRPRWLADGQLDLSMTVRNRTPLPVRIASAVVLSPEGAALSEGPAKAGGTPGIALDMVLPPRGEVDGAGTDWLGLCARLPGGWRGGRLALRLMLADARNGRPRAVTIRTSVPYRLAG